VAFVIGYNDGRQNFTGDRNECLARDYHHLKQRFMINWKKVRNECAGQQATTFPIRSVETSGTGASRPTGVKSNERERNVRSGILLYRAMTS
jgi:hypothetical protein